MGRTGIVEGTVNMVEEDSDNMKGLPIGEDNFRYIRDKGLFYVDKSAFIDRILANDSRVYLFTRPRRFGKSMNLSMLDAYLNIGYGSRAKAWFDGLEITRLRPEDPNRGAYPVILLNMKNISVDSEKDAKESFRDMVATMYGRYDFMKDSDRIDSAMRNRFSEYTGKTADDSTLTNSLWNLSMMLHAYYGKRVVILVDEYDNLINSFYGRPEQESMLRFVRNILSPALKSNDSLQFAVVTGVMQITKESIFSGLNNMVVYNILSRDFADMFGFTGSEVEAILAEANHPEKIGTAKEWYDGYRFGEAEVYNPWSILRYVGSDFEAKPYWVDTGSDTVLKGMIRDADDESCNAMVTLARGGSVLFEINPETTFEHLRATSSDLMSILAMSGYLNAVPAEDGMYRLSAPNNEVRGELERQMLSLAAPNNARRLARDFNDALIGGDTAGAEDAIGEILMRHFGSLALTNEGEYRNLLAGLLVATASGYDVSVEREAGIGRFDIRMLSNGHGPSVVIEVKILGSGDSDDLEAAARKGLEQARARKYGHGAGDVRLYGMAFRGKTVRLVDS